MTAEPRSRRSDEILQLAARLFYERDFNSVGMRQIADEAGVRGASLYHHFRSKEEMLYFIVLEVTRDFISDALVHIEQNDEFERRLGNLVEHHILYFWEHRYALSVGLREMHNLSPEHFAEVREYRLQYQHGIQDFIAAGVEADVFRCEDARLAGLAILDMMNGINGWFRPDGTLSIEQIARSYRRLVLFTVGAP